MSRVDAGYVAYLTRENAWLRARVANLTDRLAEAIAALDELRIEIAALEAHLEERQRATLAAREIDGT